MLLVANPSGCQPENTLATGNLKIGDFFMQHATSKIAQPRNTQGCSLKEYAEDKGIPLDFLKELGLSNSISNGVKTLTIPYYDEDKVIISTRYRAGLKGPDY